MQHRFFTILFHFALIAALCTAPAALGCAPSRPPTADLPAETAEAAPAPDASAVPETSAAPDGAATPAPTATPAPYNPLEDVTADLPIEQHPYYLQPMPAVRADAKPPLTAAPAAEARGHEPHTDGNYDYILYDDGTAGLVGCRFDEPTHEFDLPESVDGIPVTGLERTLMGCFGPATQHTPRNDMRIRIPKDVRYIGFNIAEAEMLLDITIEIDADNPYFQIVGNSIFSADGTLLLAYHSDPVDMHPQVYIVPDTVTDIGENAFYHCQELIAVSFPEGLRTIGSCAFDGCENLSRLTLPASLRTVGEDAFGGFALTLTVQSNDTDLGTEPPLDAIKEIRCPPKSLAAAYAAQHEIPMRPEAALPTHIAIDPDTLHLCLYEVRADGTAKILRIHSSSRAEYTLPETVGGYPVAAIGHEVLLYINEKHEDYPRLIHVPACITEIDDGALWPETIAGAAGSEAEAFAEREGIEFIKE